MGKHGSALWVLLSLGFTGCGAGTGTPGTKTLQSTLGTGQASIKVDFQHRASTAYPIPPDFLSTPEGNFRSNAAQALGILGESGLGLIKTDVRLELIYSTKQPDWSAIDQELSQISGAGMHVIAILLGTPSWLAPNPNPCQSAGFYWANALPNSFDTWAQLAATFVAHVDQKFPGLVKYFEIWNEPDLQGCMCNLPNTTVATRLQVYEQLYAVTAASMKAQGRSDGVPIQIGGPGMSNGWATAAFLPQFLGNPAVAQYVDFVSYHYYPSPTPYSAWDDSTSSSLLAKITQPDSGFAGFYSTISEQTARGLQLNAASTPVIITEYNDNPTYGVNCCRNSPRYSPLFNAIGISELLNTVYSRTRKVPSTLSYYRALDDNSFCLLGTAGTNCLYNGGALTSFPQLVTFRMISSPKYLGLSSSSYMVPSAIAISGGTIKASAFYNGDGDSLLLINPSGTPQNKVGISFANTGVSAAEATMFLLNEQNPAIAQNQLQLGVDMTQDGYIAEVDIPAYSVVGIRLK